LTEQNYRLTINIVRLVWDEPKRLTNLDKHGLDFGALTIDFSDAATIYPAKGGRFLAIGNLLDDTVAVIFARLGSEAVSIVSVRPASSKERRLL
jgi:uncharacterized DUF497 family protein